MPETSEGGSEDFRLGRDLRDQLCQLFQFAVRKGRPGRGATGSQSLLIGNKGEPRAQALPRPVPPLHCSARCFPGSGMHSLLPLIPFPEAVRAGGSFICRTPPHDKGPKGPGQCAEDSLEAPTACPPVSQSLRSGIDSLLA